MISRTRSLRLTTLVGLFTAALSITAAAVWITFSLTLYEAGEIGEHWGNLSQGPSKKIVELNRVREALGFGGAIHLFKNFILRGENERIELVAEKFEAAEAAVHRYESLPINAAEAGALTQLQDTIHRYEDALQVVVALVHKGSPVKHVDRLIKIDDSLAIAALETLDKEVFKQRLEASMQVGRAVDRIQRVILFSGVGTGSVFVVLLGVFVWFSRMRLVRPLRNLLGPVREMAAGNFDATIELEGEAEIAEVASALAHTQSELKRIRTLTSVRISIQRAAMLELLQTRATAALDLDARLARIAQIAAGALSVTRVGIWLFEGSGSGLVRHHVFEHGSGRRVRDHEVRADSCCEYREALDDARYLAVEDARSDPRIAGFIHSLRPERTVATLDIPVRRNGRVVGVVCHSERDRKRIWEVDEVAFASAIADRVAQALAESEKQEIESKQLRLAAAVEQSNDAIVITDCDGRVQCANSAYQQMTERFGWEQGDAPLRPFGLVPDEREGSVDVFREVVSGNSWQGRVLESLCDGQSATLEVQVSPITDPCDGAIGCLAMGRDVSQAVQFEEWARRSHKVEAIGILAGGIAHDFNNSLSTIFGYIEMMLEDVEPGSSIAQSLGQVQRAADHAKGLVRQILAVCQQRQGMRSPIRVDQVVRDVVSALEPNVRGTIELIQRCDLTEPVVAIGEEELLQVVTNLSQNALQAIGTNPGRVEIAIDEIESARDGSLERVPLAPGKYIRIMFRDTGCGISPAIQGRIFDPFFTTREVGEGVGLGLAVAQGIVESCGGAICLEQSNPAGSEFRVYLPATTAELADASTSAVGNRRARARILVVDDEDVQATMLKQMLERLGHEVQAITSSVKALEVVKESPQAFDLLLVDHLMPEMTGEVLAREVLEVVPEMPIVLATGFGRGMDDETLRSSGIRVCLAKPVSIQDLARAIHDVLG